MKYPPMPFQINKGRKLSDDAIKDIRENFHIRGSEMAKKYGVTREAVYYIRKSPEERKAINRKRHKFDSKEDREKANRASREARKKKRLAIPMEFNLANRLRQHDYWKRNPRKRKEILSAWAKAHPGYYRRKQREFYARHGASYYRKYRSRDPLRVLFKTSRQIQTMRERGEILTPPYF